MLTPLKETLWQREVEDGRVALSKQLSSTFVALKWALWTAFQVQDSAKPPLLIFKTVSDCSLLRYISLNTREAEMRRVVLCLQWPAPLGPWQTPKIVCLTTWKPLPRLGSGKDLILFPFSHNSSPGNTRIIKHDSLLGAKLFYKLTSYWQNSFPQGE